MSDLRHKTADQLRAEIKYQGRRIASYDESIRWGEADIAMLKEQLVVAEKKQVEYRMKRNNHHQRLVWAKIYLDQKDA